LNQILALESRVSVVLAIFCAHSESPIFDLSEH
jgi:hypothetical protein